MSGLILQGAHESEASLFLTSIFSRSALFFFPFISSLFLPRRARRNSITWNGDFSPKRSSNRRSTAVDEEEGGDESLLFFVFVLMPSLSRLLPSLNSSTSSSEVPRVLLGHEGHDTDEDDDAEEEELMASERAREIELLLLLSRSFEQRKRCEGLVLDLEKKNRGKKNQKRDPALRFRFLRYCCYIFLKGGR